MTAVSGTVKDGTGAFAARLVRAYRCDNGQLVDETVSDAITGAWSISTADTTKHFAIVHDGAVANPNWAKAILAMRFEGSNGSQVFTDLKGHAISVAGNAQISTAQAAFGASSLLLDGTGDFLTVAQDADFDVGSGDFLFRFKFYPTTTDRRALVAYSADFSMGLDYGYNGTRNVNMWASSNGSSWNMIHADGGGAGIGTISLTLNAWNEIEWSRSGNVFRTFINGVKDREVTVAGSIYTTGRNFRIGVWGNGGFNLAGRIDNFEGYKGIAGHSANYTPSASEFLGGPSGASENAQIFDNVTPV